MTKLTTKDIDATLARDTQIAAKADKEFLYEFLYTASLKQITIRKTRSSDRTYAILGTYTMAQKQLAVDHYNNIAV